MSCPCGSDKTERNGKCASCNRMERKAAKIQPSDNHTPINKRSEKLAAIEKKYYARLRTWKRGKKCCANFVHECSEYITVHHQHGRSHTAFHDEEAEEKGIVLTMDERYWIPVCMNAHRYIEDHPKFAHEQGYSYLKLSESIKL